MTKRKPPRSRSTKTAHEKGKELEQAIGAIEHTILRANPNLSEKSYTITFRKLIVVEGVKHEIDVWIEFDLGDGYKSLFIFEARNWNKTVGKDHIFAFSAKITAASAQAGYFVAKSVSSYARAAAKTDARIRLLKATDDFATSDVIRNFHTTYQDQSKSDATFEVVIKPRPGLSNPPPFNMDAATLTLNGIRIDYRAYANALVSRMIQDHGLTVPSHTMDDGVYPFDVAREFSLAPDVLLVDGYEAQSIRIKLRYLFTVVRARVVSQFDIETRGRVHVFEGIPLEGFGLQHVTIVERDGRPAFMVRVEPPNIGKSDLE
jgi:hypothetical protein